MAVSVWMIDYRMFSAETNAKTLHILQQELEEKQCITQAATKEHDQCVPW